MKHHRMFIALVAASLFSTLLPAQGQGGMVRKGVTELIEAFSKSGARESAKELAELGGETAVREVLEKAARQGGDELVGQVVALGKSGGARALKVLDADPALMAKALRGVPEGKLADSVIEAARNPELMARLVRTHGDEALTAAARHPGIGGEVIETFGSSGLKATRELGTDQVIVLAKTKGFRELPTAAQRKFLGLLDQNPRAVTNLLKLAAGGAAIVLTVDFVNQLEAEMFGEGGRLVRPMITFGWIIGGLIVAALAGYAAIKLWGVWRFTRRTVRP